MVSLLARWSINIQMKASTEQYFPAGLFIVLYKLVITLSLWMKSYSVTIIMKATEQYVPTVLFIMLNKLVLSFESVNEILKCDHTNDSYCVALSFSYCC